MINSVLNIVFLPFYVFFYNCGISIKISIYLYILNKNNFRIFFINTQKSVIENFSNTQQQFDIRTCETQPLTPGH